MSVEVAVAMATRLRALLEGLECREIEKLMVQPPDTLRAVGASIAFAARLGAHLVPQPNAATNGEKK